jgi:hypothetical protein
MHCSTTTSWWWHLMPDWRRARPHDGQIQALFGVAHPGSRHHRSCLHLLGLCLQPSPAGMPTIFNLYSVLGSVCPLWLASHTAVCGVWGTVMAPAPVRPASSSGAAGASGVRTAGSGKTTACLEGSIKGRHALSVLTSLASSAAMDAMRIVINLLILGPSGLQASAQTGLERGDCKVEFERTR